MDRLNEIVHYLKPFHNNWLKKKARICERQPEPGLLIKTEQLIADVMEKQMQGHNHRLCYICMFHFRSSLLTRSYRYQINVSDRILYLDPPIAAEFWAPEHLYSDVPVLEKLVETELKKRFVRLLSYEVEFAVRTIVNDYQKLADVYWLQAAEKIVAGDTFGLIQKRDNWKVLSGNYMDDLKIILQS